MKHITIECSEIDSREALHAAFQQMLSFPAYYGKNLDALHDCLTEISEPTELSFVGFEQLDGDFQRYFRKMIWVIMIACTENKNLRFVIGSEE